MCENPNHRSFIALFLLSTGDPAQALSDAKVSRALDPTYVKAWYREVRRAGQRLVSFTPGA